MSVEYSIIIPALNEADSIRATIERARRAADTGTRDAWEILVADSGSRDGTPEIASAMGVRVVSDASVSCRAEACNLGARNARGAVFIFLDADTMVRDGFLDHIARVLAERDFVGGAFEFKLSGRGIPLRIIELINRIRYRIWPRYYGDQCLFARAGDFRAVGGFPPRRILESSDLCLLLRERGRLGLIKTPVTTSSRRFLEGGIWRVFFSDAWIWLLDLIGRPTDRFGPAYWDYNRQRGG